MPLSLKSLEQRYLQRQTAHAMRAGQKAQLDKQHTQHVAELAELRKKLELYQKTQELLLHASEHARTHAQEKIEHLVTLALSAIMDEPYQFKMELVQYAGNWSVSFRVINPEGVVLDPIDSCGGGIADICSMALRIAVLEMYEPCVDGPILLDENFKYLSRDHVRRVIEFIQTIIEKTGRQIILVTHVPELAAGADRVFEVQSQAKTSVVVDITEEPSEPEVVTA